MTNEGLQLHGHNNNRVNILLPNCLQLAECIDNCLKQYYELTFSPKLKSKSTRQEYKKNLTLEDFFMCGHIITAKLKQTRQVTEVFDISEHWEILLELPFLATGVALRNLRQNIKVYSGQSQIWKKIFCCNLAGLHGRRA